MLADGGSPWARFIYEPPVPVAVRRQRPTVRLGIAFAGIFVGLVLQNLTLSALAPIKFAATLVGAAGLCWFVLVFADLFMHDYGRSQLWRVALVGACVGSVGGYLGSRLDPWVNAIIGLVVVAALAPVVGVMVLGLRRRLPPPPSLDVA